MVVFTCEACNESLKKNKVEEHLYRCRRARHVTCIDCQVDFDRESYKAHTSCISEVEKYSGPGYVAKASANKGAKKQDDWFQRVQSAIDSCSGSGGNQQLAGVLRKVRESANVPRKQAKFVNFCRNSMKWASPGLIQQAWSLLAEGAAAAKAQTPQAKTQENGQREAADDAVEVEKNNKMKTKQTDEKIGEQEETEAALEVEEQKATKEREKKKKKRRSRVEETDPQDEVDEEVVEADVQRKARDEEAEVAVEAEEQKTKEKKKNQRRSRVEETDPQDEADKEVVEADDQRKARDKEAEVAMEAEEQKTKEKKKKKRRSRVETDQHEAEAEVAVEASELQNAKKKETKKRHRQPVDEAEDAGGDSGEQSEKDKEKKKQKKKRRRQEENSEVAELDTPAIPVA